MATSMIRRGSNLRKYVNILSQTCARNNQHLAAPTINDDDSHYPKIKPKLPPGEWGDMDRNIAWMWAHEGEVIEKCRTYQEKVNYLTQFVYKVWMFYAIDTTPNMLDYKCAVTKTEMFEADSKGEGLPPPYDAIDTEKEFQTLKPIVMEVLQQAVAMNRQHIMKKESYRFLERPGNRVFEMEYVLSRLLVRTLLLNILGSLRGRHKHVLNSRFDVDSKIAAFWVRDGFERFPMKKLVAPTYLRQDKATFFGEQAVDFHIRKDKPLPEFLPVTDGICCHSTYDKSMQEYNPRVLGQFSDQIQRKIDPGYVVGDEHKFTHLNVIFPNNKAMNLLGRYGEEQRQDAETGYLLSTCFLTTLAQAHGLGFNQYEELTYPLTTQTILTDGQDYTLSAYQLNTMKMWKDDKGNPLQNIMWLTPKMRLYDIDENGRLGNFNDDLFRMLIKFVLIKPSDRDGINLTPNIDSYPTGHEISDKKIYTYVEEKVTYDNA